jgi:hypothetical protein
MHYLLTPVSQNSKTGPIAVTTSSKATCPSACPFKKSGCYAATGAINIHWLSVSRGQMGADFAGFIKGLNALPVGQLTRLNQAGDLPGAGNRINRKELDCIVKAGQGKRFFTYTHKPVIGKGERVRRNRAAIKAANKGGTVINLSGSNLGEADKLKALNIGPVVCVLPLGAPDTLQTPNGHRVVKCPAQTREYVTCSTCKLCAQGKRSVIVGFEAHGNAKKIVSKIASI